MELSHQPDPATSEMKNGKRLIRDTPLAKIAGSMAGEGWETLLREIERAREEDREELKKLYPIEKTD